MAKTALKQVNKSDSVAEPDKAPPTKSKRKLWVIAALLLLAGGGGGAAWYFNQQKHGDEAQLSAEGGEVKAAPAATSKPPIFITLDQFTVNLQPGEMSQYLQLALVLKVGDAPTVDIIKMHMPEIRSRILLLLSSKRPNDLLTAEGKAALAAEIAQEVKQPIAAQLKADEVINVFFTSFIIQ